MKNSQYWYKQKWVECSLSIFAADPLNKNRAITSQLEMTPDPSSAIGLTNTGFGIFRGKEHVANLSFDLLEEIEKSMKQYDNRVKMCSVMIYKSYADLLANRRLNDIKKLRKEINQLKGR